MECFVRNVVGSAMILAVAGLVFSSSARANGLQYSYNSQVKIVIPNLSESYAVFGATNGTKHLGRKKHGRIGRHHKGFKPRRHKRHSYFIYNSDRTRYGRVPKRPGRIGKPHW